MAELFSLDLMRHRWTFRVVLVALILLECFLLFAALSDSHLDRPATGRAWHAWRQYPSAETEAAWNAERGMLHREQVVIDAVIWSLIIAAGAGIYYVAKRQRAEV